MRAVIERTAPNREHYEIVATDHQGDYFSVMATVWRTKAGMERGAEPISGGCLHSEILALVPELAPVVLVHLADATTGLPLHAKANGWYFYSGAAANYEREQVANGRDYGYSRQLETSDHDRAAQCLNIPALALPTGLDKDGFSAFVDSLAETYAAQAQAARDVITSLSD